MSTDPRVDEALRLSFEYVRAWDRVQDCVAPRAALESHLAAAFAKFDADYSAMRELVVNGGTEIARLTAELSQSRGALQKIGHAVGLIAGSDVVIDAPTAVIRLVAELEEARKALQAAEAEKAVWVRRADSSWHAKHDDAAMLAALRERQPDS